MEEKVNENNLDTKSSESQKIEPTKVVEPVKVITDITYDEFAKVILKVGLIEEAVKIEKSEKLLKLKVNLGEETGARQIIAGLAKRYQAEELIGRRVVVVSNLKPAKLMGEMSNGMLLAGSDDEGNLELVAIPDNIKIGGTVK